VCLPDRIVDACDELVDPSSSSSSKSLDESIDTDGKLSTPGERLLESIA
jgi:hypothetical protein